MQKFGRIRPNLLKSIRWEKKKEFLAETFNFAHYRLQKLPKCKKQKQQQQQTHKQTNKAKLGISSQIFTDFR